jgi:hypothetical protein
MHPYHAGQKESLEGGNYRNSIISYVILLNNIVTIVMYHDVIRKLEMTTTYKFEDFFDTQFEEATQFGYPKPRDELVEEIKQDFEDFLNRTEMGKNFAPQLVEAINGTEEKAGIGKIKITEFTDIAIERFNIYKGTEANWSHNTLNGNDVVFISFNSTCLNEPNNPKWNSIDVEGNPHPFSAIETFLHELKHAVDTAYTELDRDRSLGYVPLHEFDAITFAGESRRQIEIYQGKEPTPERDPYAYTFEEAMAQNPSLRGNFHPELEIATGYRILKERGITVKNEEGIELEAQELLYQQNPETQFSITTLDGKSKAFRDMVREEQHNTKIAGESIKWVDAIQSSNSHGVREL